MREIKFRAWDNRKKEWLLGYELPNLGGFSLFGEAVLLGEWSGVLDTFLFARDGYIADDLRVMQYTGLKDKNGVDIWEGDVVRYHYLDKRLENHPQTCKVVYEPKAAAFLLRPDYYEPATKYLGGIEKSNRYSETRVYELCEVIGNIYENPGLV